jgi:O-antigen/teichoic acid export membrane protein
MWRSLDKFVLGPARRWARVFAKFTIIQAIAQLIGVLAGIVVVRLLAKQDYALYTIANSMLWALVILSDGGISAAAAGIGGRAWQDSAHLSRTIATALAIRWRLCAILVVPVAGTLAALLLKNGAAPRPAAVLIGIVLVGAVISLGASVYVVIPRLLGNVRLLQVVVMTTAVARLSATLVLGFFGLTAETAMLAIALSLGVEFWQVRRWARRQVGIDSSTEIDQPVRDEFIRVTRRQIPNALYYIFQTQVSIWLLSVFGTYEHIADLGALTRISVLYVALSAAVDGLMMPRFARCSDPFRLWSLYLQIFFGLIAVAIVPVLVVWAWPHPFLWVLGPKYLHLSTELLLAMLSALTGVLNSVSWGLNATRAWFLPVKVYVGLGLILQIVLLLAIGAATVREVLVLSILMNVGQTIMNFGGTVVFIRQVRRSAVSAALEAGG